MCWNKVTAGAAALAAVTGVLLIGGLTAWFRASAAAPPATNPPAAQAAGPEEPPDNQVAATAVTASRPVRRELAPFEDFTGRLKEAYVPIMARVSGRLLKAHSDLDGVKKGEVLFELDPTPFKAALAKAKAALAAAKAGAERAAAEAAVERARQDLEGARVVAPIDGRLHQITAPAEGDEVAGAWERPVQLAGLDPSDEIGVRFDMDERTFLRYPTTPCGARRERGRGAAVCRPPGRDGLSPQRNAHVVRGSLRPRRRHDRRIRRLSGPRSPIFVGHVRAVRVPFGKPAPALEIADSAIGTDQGKRYVWVIGAHSVVERREVRLGQRDGDLIVVKEGLEPDDWVVVAGGGDLHAGDKVEPCRAAMPGSKTGP